jgi:uncharacterized membrane protein/ribosomal protein L40E
MAYCKKCGAYIPDELTACLACGYDDLAEQQKASSQSSGSAASKKTENKSSSASGNEKYKQVDSDFLRKQLEEQRKRQQENSRKWAQTEYAQRQKAKEEQTRNFTNTSGRSGSDVYRTVRNAMSSDDTGKVMAGLSYISVLFMLPYLFRKDDEFATYHAKQGMGLFIASIIGDIAGGLLGVGWLVGLARIFLAITGIKNVIDGKKKPLPYIGDLFKNMFK